MKEEGERDSQFLLQFCTEVNIRVTMSQGDSRYSTIELIGALIISLASGFPTHVMEFYMREAKIL